MITYWYDIKLDRYYTITRLCRPRLTAIPYQKSARTKDLVYGILLARTYEHCSRTVITGTPPKGRGLGLVEYLVDTPPNQVLARSPKRPGYGRTGYILKHRIRATTVSFGLTCKQTAATAKKAFFLPLNSLGNTLDFAVY